MQCHALRQFEAPLIPDLPYQLDLSSTVQLTSVVFTVRQLMMVIGKTRVKTQYDDNYCP
jgi:hypothetical protein